MVTSAHETLRIATRGSTLALWQANHAADTLRRRGIASVELLVVRTTGDQVQDVPLSGIGDRGLFTRQVDDALLDRRAAVAVHSLKDVPTTLPDGLRIVAVMERADPADVLIARPDLPAGLSDLPADITVGTSSLRRRAQLGAVRPDLRVVDLRGNVDTRIARVREGVVDATILARAGLLRLGRQDEATDVLAAPAWLPAVGQGALAIVMRHDHPAAAAIAALDHPPTRAAVTAERALLRRLEGGCQVPLGALATIEHGGLQLVGAVFSLDGSRSVRAAAVGDPADAEAIGLDLAESLLDDGAGALLAEIRAATTPAVPAP